MANALLFIVTGTPGRPFVKIEIFTSPTMAISFERCRLALGLR